MLRRAVRYGQQILGAEAGFFAKLVPTVVATYGEAFPELVKNKKMIIEVLEEEEAAFSQMLTRGVKYFNDLVDGSEEKKSSVEVIKGDEAFFLYDSLGFRWTDAAHGREELRVDVEGFQQQMEEQKEQSRAACRPRRARGGRAHGAAGGANGVARERRRRRGGAHGDGPPQVRVGH